MRLLHLYMRVCPSRRLIRRSIGCMSIHSLICLPIVLSVCPLFCPSVCPSIHPYVCNHIVNWQILLQSQVNSIGSQLYNSMKTDIIHRVKNIEKNIALKSRTCLYELVFVKIVQLFKQKRNYGKQESSVATKTSRGQQLFAQLLLCFNTLALILVQAFQKRQNHVDEKNCLSNHPSSIQEIQPKIEDLRTSREGREGGGVESWPTLSVNKPELLSV